MFISLLCMWRRIRDRRTYGFDLWLKLQFWDVVDPFISFLLPLSPILSFFACSAILPACSLSLLLSTKIDPHILTIYLTQRSSVWYSGINNIMNLLEMWFFFSLTKIGLRGCEALFHHYFWHSFSLRDITIVLILQSDFFGQRHIMYALKSSVSRYWALGTHLKSGPGEEPGIVLCYKRWINRWFLFVH